MKFIGVAILVLCIVVASSEGRKKAPKCDTKCTAEYEPVCGGNPSDKSVKPRLFGNKCVLDVHNCENKSNLVPVSMDQCKGSGGVRLS